MIGFNSGHYEAIDLSEWLARNPVDVLATNLSLPREIANKLPYKSVFISPKS
ncbi:UNVERIFIED_CONTAM: hypothetical protein ABIC26_004142 [Paenibacillus sp. PvR008]